MKWDTKEMTELLSAIGGIAVKVFPPGGDYDTEYVKVTADKAAIWVFGMKDTIKEEGVLNPSDTEVDWVLVCADPKEGMAGATDKDYALLGRVLAALSRIGIEPHVGGYNSLF